MMDVSTAIVIAQNRTINPNSQIVANARWQFTAAVTVRSRIGRPATKRFVRRPRKNVKKWSGLER
jgi:hypothetical protein